MTTTMPPWIFLQLDTKYDDNPTAYNLLDKRVRGPSGQKGDGGYQITLAVFNFGEDDTGVTILKTCIAIGLWCSVDAEKSRL